MRSLLPLAPREPAGLWFFSRLRQKFERGHFELVAVHLAGDLHAEFVLLLGGPQRRLGSLVAGGIQNEQLAVGRVHGVSRLHAVRHQRALQGMRLSGLLPLLRDLRRTVPVDQDALDVGGGRQTGNGEHEQNGDYKLQEVSHTHDSHSFNAMGQANSGR